MNILIIVLGAVTTYYVISLLILYLFDKGSRRETMIQMDIVPKSGSSKSKNRNNNKLFVIISAGLFIYWFMNKRKEKEEIDRE